MSDIGTSELCDRFGELYTGAITDVLDDMGYHDQTMDRDIGPLVPDMHAAGIAYPVVGRPNRSVDPDENLETIVRMLSAVPADAMLVYETNDEASAHIGELSVTALEETGCRGAVLDGGARDVSHILEYEFPVFSKYETPADAVPRWELLEWDVEAVVGGIEVTPGDVIVADVDGAVVVPRSIAPSVLEEAEAVASTENEVRAAVREGVSPLDAFNEHGKF